MERVILFFSANEQIPGSRINYNSENRAYLRYIGSIFA
jgi:hypothetical protein